MPERFEQTGELVAVSGGDAGAKGACVTCHGLDGGGDGAVVPRLAGLDQGYILRQLELYASGQRRHPQMEWIAGRLDDGARVRVAEYYARQRWAPGAAALSGAASCTPEAARLYHLGDAARGLQACAACHGEGGAGAGPGNPALAGQPADYVAHQLRAWRAGERRGDPHGAMMRISQRLHPAEIAPLSDYIGRLTGDRNRPAPREGCPPARRRDPRSDA